MKKFAIVLIAVAALVVFYSGVAMSHKKAHKKGEVINKICPVMGGEIGKDTPYTVEYKDKKIGLCCPACIEKFNADPEKYMQKIEKKCIIKCPKCGAEIDVKKECKTQCKKGDKFCPFDGKTKEDKGSKAGHKGHKH